MKKDENIESNEKDIEFKSEEIKKIEKENNIIKNEQIEFDLEVENSKMDEKIIEIPESKLLALKEECKANKKLADEHFSKLQRVQADFENYKKILQKDKVEYCKYAEKRLLLQFLNIIDDFEITLNAIKKEIKDKKKIEGLEIINKKIFEMLDKEEVKPIKSVGKTFDPFIHEALLSELTEKYPENTILEEIKKGYYYKDKVLRPALVKIAKNK